MKELRPCTTLNGKWDGYCHLCWNAVYVLWADTVPPDYTRCAYGDFKAHECPDALARARNQAKIRKILMQEDVKP